MALKYEKGHTERHGRLTNLFLRGTDPEERSVCGGYQRRHATAGSNGSMCPYCIDRLPPRQRDTYLK